MFRKRDDFLPPAVFFNLRAGDDCRITAGIECANYGIQRNGIRQDRWMHFAGIHGRTFVCPVVHGNGKEYRSHGRLHREMIPAHDGRRHVLRPERFAGPFHAGLDDFHGAAHEKRFRQYLAAILLSGGDDQRNVAVRGIDDGRKPIAGAGNRVQVDESRFAAGHGVSKRHARCRSFVQSEDISKIRRHVAQKGQFRRARIAEDHCHLQLAQEFISNFSDRAQHRAPDLQDFE